MLYEKKSDTTEHFWTWQHSWLCRRAALRQLAQAGPPSVARFSCESPSEQPGRTPSMPVSPFWQDYDKIVQDRVTPSIYFLGSKLSLLTIQATIS